jgi:hypothetical protein
MDDLAYLLSNKANIILGLWETPPAKAVFRTTVQLLSFSS